MSLRAKYVLAVIDQREYNIAVYKALADLAYAENNAASLYYNAAMIVTSAYGGLNSAHAAAKRAQGELAAAEYKLRTDEAALKRADVVAADRQEALRLQEQLLQAIYDLTHAVGALVRCSAARKVKSASDEARADSWRHLYWVIRRYVYSALNQTLKRDFELAVRIRILELEEVQIPVARRSGIHRVRNHSPRRLPGLRLSREEPHVLSPDRERQNNPREHRRTLSGGLNRPGR